MSKFLLLAGFLALTACEISQSGDAPALPPIDAFAHKVTGPTIDGAWRSECRYRSTDNAFAVTTLTVTGQDIVRGTDSYSDNKCSIQTAQKAHNGKFRFTKQYTAGFYEVEYRLAIGANATQIISENVQLKNGMLFISGYYSGEVAPTIAMLPPLTVTPYHAAEIGQVTEFSGVKKGQSFEETYTVKSFNSTYQDWQVQVDRRGASSSSTLVNMKDLASTLKFDKTLIYCESSKGVREVITVPAGTFLTCKVEKADGIYWYANLPIQGAAKITSLDGKDIMELKSFRSNSATAVF